MGKVDSIQRKKLKSINADSAKQPEKHPTTIIIYHRDVDNGDWEEVGEIVWDGEKWNLNGDCPWMEEDLKEGFDWMDKTLYGNDREFYLPYVNSNYTSWSFKAED